MYRFSVTLLSIALNVIQLTSEAPLVCNGDFEGHQKYMKYLNESYVY